MTAFVSPAANDVKTMFETFFGEDASVAEATPANLGGWHVATFVSDENELVAVCACDAEFVAYSGAAFSMLPARVAAEMVETRDFTDVVKSNFHEIMNICSRLMMSDSSPHLRLEKTCSPADGSACVTQLQASGVTAGFEVSIPGYGKGRMAVIVT